MKFSKFANIREVSLILCTVFGIAGCKAKSDNKGGGDNATPAYNPLATSGTVTGGTTTGTTTSTAADCITYERHVSPVLTRYCISCHNAGAALNLSTYESLLVTDATGSVISKSIASIEARRMPPNQPAGSTTSIVDPNDLAWLKSFQAAPRRLNSECTPAATGTDWSTTTAGTTTGGTSTTEYGTALDSAFAVDLAAALKAARYLGTNPLTTYLSNGTAPHGEVQEVLTPRLLTVKTVQGKVWVKHNYGPFPTGSTNSNKIKSVTENRDRYREAVTVIFQRERGYHPETGDLFWVKYDPAGNVLKDSALRPLAGKIGKGDPNSCIGCHATACGSDYVCSND